MRTNRVQILDNPNALPRAWLVHRAVQGDALMVASEIAYPAWHAYLDGQAVDMLVPNTRSERLPYRWVTRL